MSSGKSMPRRQTYITEVIDEEALEADEFEDAHEQPDELEVEAEQEEQPEDEEGQEATDDVTDDLTNLAQVLTVTARKLSGITLGRKFSTGNKSKKSPDELRKVTHCSACGGLGHWYQDQARPMNQGAGAGKAGKSGKGSKGSSSSSYRQTSGPDKKADRPHQVSVVHHEHGSLEVNDAPPSDYGTMFAINMVTNLPFQVHETKGFGTGGHDLTGYMVLDSACQRTCAGKAWYRSHVDMLFKHHLKTKEIPSEDVFQFGKGEPTTFLMRTAPPSWLQRWRRLVSCLEAFKRNIWIYMAGGVRLGIMPKSWLDHAVPPEMSPRLHPEKCQHTVIKRYGNAHGRFARCQTCLRKWKWNNKKEDWDIWSSQGGGYLASSSRQLPLPQPSSKATASAGSTSKARPKPKAKSAAVPCSAWTSTLSGWTSFEMGYTLHTDHLTQEEQVEVFRILEQRSPLEAEPTTVAEFAFLNEEHFRPHREKLELAADRKRHERLVELGVLIEEDEEIMDWGLIYEIAKRLRGDWNKAADILEKECQVYATSKPTMERPPPYADLWELFAGSSNMTRLAAQYNLNTLQPMDLLYGQNFKDPAMRKMIFQKLDHYKPWLVIMGVDCRLWNQFNINLNWSSPDRRLALRHLQDDEKVLVEFAVAVALRQHRAGRYFLLENPQRSQLWNLEEVTDLLGLRGVWTTDLDCGAYGAEVDGQPIAKPMRWAGNQPGLHEQLNRRLTPLQKMYCTPIQGKLTRRSQEYPDELCHAVLQELRALIFQKEPLRFGPPQHKVYATAYPTSDLDLWDDIVKYVDNVYERGAKRPFNFPVDSDMGKRIQELFRIKAVRIQAFYAPTSRRIPANVDEYFTRAAFLQYADKTRAVEVEDLDQIEFPRQRFSKAVAFGIFAYGFRMETTSPATPAPDADRAIIPGLTTDISFSGVDGVDQHVKRSLARLHLNLGHPSTQELMRLLAHQGRIPATVIKAVQGMSCSTCQRLKPPQEPRPTSMPSLVAGQFGDELQADVFYCRLLDGTSFPVLGIIDRATGLHMAGLMKNRDSETTFELLTDRWLRPYGLPLKFSCDPDRTFRGEFEKRLMSLGVIVEHCPPEAHYLIGMIERRNAILHVTPVTQWHSPEDVLSTSTQPFRDPEHPGLRAELVRSEALKTLIDLNAQQQFRRALLRKTRNTSIPDLQPGQRCAVWRWTKKGVRKRGAWLAARFLSWDPAHEGKQAWVRLGASTTLVTAEQLRAAHSFEDWCPDEQDIKVLKDASKNFGQHMLEDERGPPPPEEALTQDAHLEQEALEYDNTAPPMTPAMAVPATPAQASQAAPSTPAPQGSTTTNVQVNIDSPTHTHHHTTVQTLQRFGDLPKQLRTTRSRGPTTPLESAHSKRTRATPAELAASSTEHLANTATGETAPAIAPHSEFHQAEVDTPQAPTILEEPQHPPEGPQVTFAPTPAELVPVPDDEDLAEPHEVQHQQEANTDAAAAGTSTEDAAAAEPQAEQAHTPQPMADEPLPTLPTKRPFDTLALSLEEDGTFSLASRFWNGTPPQHYGPQSKTFFKCYTTTAQRQQDIANTDKPAEESDTSVDSEDSSEQADNKQPQRQHHAAGEVKAKCRIVCLGHEDPDLDRLSRSSPTPGRTIEMICYQMIVSGLNGELFNTTLKWSAWAGDAQTAFLQGRQKDSERPLPLYMKAPKDGLISKTSCWSHELYQILGNVYGLSNAPHLWSEEVSSRLSTMGYGRHAFDPQLFIKRDSQDDPISAILVYVDDFLGLFREDYDISEVQKLFRWGDLKAFEPGNPITFKGKELLIETTDEGRYKMSIKMEKFIEGLDSGKIPKGRSTQDPKLTASEHQEFRSELRHLKSLYDGISYLKKTSSQGLCIQDIPFRKDTLILAFSDASWCNASRSGSQIGLLAGFTTPSVKMQPTKYTVIDWRSCRAPRVCRSTLAAEACAADEASDRASYLNRMASELHFNEPAHRVGARMAMAQAIDAKSLYDALLADAPNISDRRSLVSVRSVQEVDEKLMYMFRAWLESPMAVLVEHPENASILARSKPATKLPKPKAPKQPAKVDEEEADGEDPAPDVELKRMKELLGDDIEEDDEDEEDKDEDEDEDEDEEGESKSTKAAIRKPGFDIDQGQTIFVRNVPFDATADDLKEVFRRFGRVGFVKLVADKTGQNAHRGSAFVKFAEVAGAEAALATEAEADQKLKELSSVIKRSQQRELPAVEGFGVSLKGRRLVLKSAVKPQEASELSDKAKPQKGAAAKERKAWLHLLHVGDIPETSPKWQNLSKSEQRQREEGRKERKWRINNPNFAIHPQRLSVRNLPTFVDANKLREAVLKNLVQTSKEGKKQDRLKQAREAILKAILVRDSERRSEDGERRSKGFGFIAFKDHDSAMRTLEFLNDNPTVFGGARRPIVEFAVEDKRKLRMLEEEKEKFEKKLAEKRGDKGEDDAAPKRKFKRKRPKPAESEGVGAEEKRKGRGAKQREKRRAQKAAEERNKARTQHKEMKAKMKELAERDRHQRKPRKARPNQLPDANPKSAKLQRKGDLEDDFELRALERFRRGGKL
ncbi:unnamed protein product [Durusdinium trenchii]|uniref:Copia protein n=1 Tax=Durusdinium trenchii TaxID=1381693 RepID=A0ABP0M4C7_9DINO